MALLQQLPRLKVISTSQIVAALLSSSEILLIRPLEREELRAKVEFLLWAKIYCITVILLGSMLLRVFRTADNLIAIDKDICMIMLKTVQL